MGHGIPVRRALPLLVIAVVAAGAVGWQLTRPAQGALTGSGTIEAVTVAAGAQRPGIVAAVLVQEGDRVKAGDVLVRLDTKTLEAQRDRVDLPLEGLIGAVVRGHARRPAGASCRCCSRGSAAGVPCAASARSSRARPFCRRAAQAGLWVWLGGQSDRHQITSRG